MNATTHATVRPLLDGRLGIISQRVYRVGDKVLGTLADGSVRLVVVLEIAYSGASQVVVVE